MSEQTISSQTSKRKKKIIIRIIIAVVVITVMVLTIVYALPIRMGIAHIHNKMILRSVRNDFVDAIEDIDGMTVTEVQSTKGKLSGNGNGMDYFVAVLVPRSCAEDADGIMAALKDKSYNYVQITDQTGQEIVSKYLEHKDLFYETDISSGEYVTICCVVNSDKSDMFDIEAH